MGNCFLIADEVGLGKTRTARTIAYEMARLDGFARVFYLASNGYIAGENIKEFSGEKKAMSPDSDTNFDDLVNYQKATAKRGLKAFGYDIQMQTKGNPPPSFAVESGRLSTLKLEKDGAYTVYSLTPKTSFHTDRGAVYEGNQEERQRIAELPQPEAWDIYLQTAFDYELLTYSKGERENHKHRLLEYAKNFEQKDNRAFKAWRRILANATVLKLKPTLIILDEFQKYRSSLTAVGQGDYSVTYLYGFLQNMKKIIQIEPYCQLQNQDASLSAYLETGVKILLLSATPYQYDHKLAPIPIRERKEEDAMDAVRANENPFESFQDLQRAMARLGADTSCIANYMSRTERSMFFTEEDRKLFSAYAVGEYDTKQHIAYLKNVFQTGKEIAWFSNAYLSITPNFWRFTKGYQCHERLCELFANDSQLLETLNAIDPSNHVLLQELIAQSLPEGVEHLLWIPPCRRGDDGSALGDYGKTVVFTRYHMTARAVSYFVNDILEKRLSCDVSAVPSLERLVFEENQPLCRANQGQMKALFNTTRGKQVICKLYGTFGEDSVKAYCKTYDLEGVLREYAEVKGDKQDVSLVSNQEHLFAARYTEEQEDFPGNDKVDVSQLSKAFNSPFYPFVLVATSTAQEGINLHLYADKLMHWETATDANAFQQREGRIDRPNSLVIRRRLVELALVSGCSQMAQMDFQTMKDHALTMLEHVYKDDAATMEKLRRAHEAGILPMWYLPKLQETSPQIKRILAPTLLSGEKAKAEKIHTAAAQYAKFLGKNRDGLCAFED